MIKWRKRIPILLVLTLVLALVAMTISAVQFDREKDKELRALQAEKIKADRGALTSAVRTLSLEEQAALEAGGDAAKAGRLDGDPRALLSATAPPAPPKEEAGRPTKRDEFGPNSIAGPPLQKVVPAGTFIAENDDCHDVTPDALPVHWTGNNEGATYDAYCQWFGDYPNVWHGFTIDECMDITIEYCPTAAGWANGWLNLVTDCDCPDGALISYTSFDWGCANGNPRMYFLGLEAGTYYYPVMLDPANGAIGDYDLYVYGTPCPGAPENDDCVDAEAVGDVTNKPFSTSSATPDGNGYTTGPNIWYCYTATCNGIATISLCGSSYDTKIAGYDGCTCDPLGTELANNDDAPCDKGDRSLQSEIEISVVEGNQYLIEVGGYGSASGDGLLSISCVSMGEGACCYEDGSCVPGMSQEDCDASGGTSWLAGQDCGPPNPCPQPGQPGDNCLDPLTVDIPSSLPWCDLDQTTCGRGNSYEDPDDDICMYYYTNGEDIFYEITVSSAVTVNFHLDPKGTTYSGMGLFSSCPPTMDNCIDYETSSSSSPKSMTCVSLDPGVYYLMIDTWASPNCIPDFDLCIVDTTCEALENDNCADATPVGEVTDLSFSTDAATFDGGGSCQSAPNVWYCYTATETGTAIITLCGSGYDTKMAVYDGCACDPLGTELGCNDDSPCDFMRALQSTVEIPVTAGNSYLVEVGGYSSNVGSGILNIWVEEPPPPCALECPPGGHYENEACGEDANGGCNMGTPMFEPINCDDTVCGTVWANGDTRDTDWYELVLEEATLVTWSGMACFPFVIGFVDTSDCALAAAIDPYAVGDPLDLISCSRVCGPGTYWLFASHQLYDGYPCGMNNDYWAAVTCQPLTEGACCYEDGSCSPGWEEEACYASGGTSWMGGQDCDPNPCPQPPYECPEPNTPEGETCGDDINGGCNSPTPIFGAISCGETVCGEAWSEGGSRDTDWYTFELADSALVTLSGKGGLPLQVLLIAANSGDCVDYAILGSFVVDANVEGSIVMIVPPGTYWAWAGEQSFYDYPCASGPWMYHMTLECGPVVPMYCDASGGCDEYIERVEVGTIDNTSVCEGYGDFTALSTDMVPGTGYPITITINGGYSVDDGAVWVDWNQDLDFYDDGERIPLDPETGYGPYLGTITPPMDAEQGETRMRIRLSYSGTPAEMDPCGATSWGEVEDYTINVGGELPVTYLFEPDPVYVLYKFAIDPMNGYIYLGGEAVGGDVGDMTNVELKVDDCVVPITATEIIDGYGELTGDVLKLTFGITEYIECEEGGELIYGVGESFFDVYYDMPGSPDQVMNGQVIIIGHTSGDLNLDGSVNVADVTYFVEWLFAGGPAPEVLEVADVDGSGGNPNVGDLTYLVEYLFNDGPPPMHQ